MNDSIRKYSRWNKKRIIAIGGGTRLSSLLSGLKHFNGLVRHDSGKLARAVLSVLK